MWEFLNNASIGAFVGAFFAFILVVLTDLRRRYRIKNLLVKLVSNNLAHAQKKLVSVNTNIAMVKKDGSFTDSPYMRFSTQSIKNNQFQVLDLLKEDEIQSLDALIFWMEAIDDLLDEVTKTAKKLKLIIAKNFSEIHITNTKTELILSLEDAERNLDHLIGMAKHFIEGSPKQILELKLPIGGAR